MRFFEDESSADWAPETVDTKERGEDAVGDDAAAADVALEYSLLEFGVSIFDGKGVPSCTLFFAFRLAITRVALRLSTHCGLFDLSLGFLQLLSQKETESRDLWRKVDQWRAPKVEYEWAYLLRRKAILYISEEFGYPS